MRLHRFYISTEIGSQKELHVQNSSLSNQLRKVFRMKRGDDVILFDGSGNDYVSSLVDFDGEEGIVFVVNAVEKSRFIPKTKTFLYASVVKKDNFEWITEKATELGITHIIPVISERSEKKSLNMDRLQKIIIEASEQSGRGNISEIKKPISLVDAIADKQTDIRFAFHLEGETVSYDKKTDVSVFIGPEGGWSMVEIDLFRQNNITIVSLGKQILRAETAVIAALAKVIL